LYDEEKLARLICAAPELLEALDWVLGHVTRCTTKDSATDEAIKAFKVANKLAADSVVGGKVKELLGLK
jgi:hypothetical protein